MTRQRWQDVDLGKFEGLEILPRRRGNPGGKKMQYLSTFATFDVETSKIELDGQPHAFVYVWMMYFKQFDLMVTGRTIGEYFEFLQALKDHLSVCLVVYVHNLSYEFQFLSGVYEFASDDVFAVKSRKVAKAVLLETYEFRCSQILSNMSLALYTKKYGVKHGKLSGDEYDYSKIRYPWSDLTEREWDYCTNDVVGLSECIDVELYLGHFDVSTIPLTSTGFVRRDLKRAMRDVSHTLVPSIQPPYEVYQMLRAAFRGGDVHANRYYANQIMHNVKSFDRSSSYPDVLCNCKYPMSRFVKIEDLSPEGIDREIKRKRALLLRIAIRDCRLKNPRWPSPYLSRHKCEILEVNSDNYAQFDNGRILSAPLVITTVTDIDFAIISEQYAGDYYVLDGYSARYGFLPTPYVDCVRMYYDSKTRLKGDPEQIPFYEKSKNKLNSCYGCAAQDPVKLSNYYINGEWFPGDSPDLPEELRQDPKEVYKDYCRKSWSMYAWGVWCTAWARLRLYEGVKMAALQRPDLDAECEGKHSDFVYCDTDSVKYIGDIDWTEYNAERKKASIENRAFATDAKGRQHYMGVYEADGEYARFLTLGSKKYVTEDPDGTMHVTISGVGKRKAPAEIAKAGGMEAMIYNDRQGLFTFREAGGTELKYNDEKYYTTLDIDGHKLDITRNVAICDSTYTLGMTEEYYLLLNACLTDFS